MEPYAAIIEVLRAPRLTVILSLLYIAEVTPVRYLKLNMRLSLAPRKQAQNWAVVIRNTINFYCRLIFAAVKF